MSGFFTSIYKNVKVGGLEQGALSLYLVTRQAYYLDFSGFLLGNKCSHADWCNWRNSCPAGRWQLQVLPLPRQVWQTGRPQGQGEDCKDFLWGSAGVYSFVSLRWMLRSTAMRSLSRWSWTILVRLFLWRMSLINTPKLYAWAHVAFTERGPKVTCQNWKNSKF